MNTHSLAHAVVQALEQHEGSMLHTQVWHGQPPQPAQLAELGGGVQPLVVLHCLHRLAQ